MAKVKKLKGNFTMVANTWLKDPKLSAKAKGIICFLQSVNDDWEYSISGLATQFKDGYDAIRSGLEELEQAGYLKWERIRNDDGQFTDVSVELFEKPIRDKAKSGKSPLGEIGNNKIKTITKERTKQSKDTLTIVKEEPSDKAVSGEIVEQPKEYGNADINNLFRKWAESCGFEIKNKIQLNRFACQRLIKSRGVQAIENVIKILPETFTDQYAPAVKNFMDLEEKWDNLRLWYGKRHAKTQARKEVKDGVEYTYDGSGNIIGIKL